MAEAQMPDTPEIPEGVSADYANTAAREALNALQQTPDYEHVTAFLNALREGFLVVDVTGSSAKDTKKGRKGIRVRTIRSTRGQLVLPLFTSMAELRLAAAAGTAQGELKGVITPAREALALIESDRFVAAEFDKGSAALVLLRKYVALAAGDEEVTAAMLEGMR